MNVGQSYRRLDSIIHSPRSYAIETGVIKKVTGCFFALVFQITIYSVLFCSGFFFLQCKKRGMNDYVEFRGGQGLDTQLMQVGDDVCGFRPFPRKY